MGRGRIQVIHGHDPAGKNALLFTLAGRVRRIEGDLKVLGHVLPQHINTVRREVAVISCHESSDPAAEVQATPNCSWACSDSLSSCASGLHEKLDAAPRATRSWIVGNPRSTVR